jgi:hypothetical protein
MRNGEKVMRKIVLVTILAIYAAAFAQSSDVPTLSRKQIMFANAANIGASIFNARASWYGAHQCVSREELTRDPRGKFVRSLEISLPIDAVVGFASWKTLPLLSTGTQTSMAATQFSAGCF